MADVLNEPGPAVERPGTGDLDHAYGRDQLPLVRLANRISRRSLLHKAGVAAIAASAGGLIMVKDVEKAAAAQQCDLCCSNCVCQGWNPDASALSILCQCLPGGSNSCPSGSTPAGTWYNCGCSGTVQGVSLNCCSQAGCSGCTSHNFARFFQDCCQSCSAQNFTSCDGSTKPSCQNNAYSCSSKNRCIRMGCSNCVYCT